MEQLPWQTPQSLNYFVMFLIQTSNSCHVKVLSYHHNLNATFQTSSETKYNNLLFVKASMAKEGLCVNAKSGIRCCREAEGQLRRPGFGIVERVALSCRRLGYRVGVNSLSAGSIVPIECYEKDRRVSSIMLEINRCLYMYETTGIKNPAFHQVKQHLSEVLNDLRSLELESFCRNSKVLPARLV
ncbi:N-formylglutamate amidohydrolase [Thermodesulfobacteriota bacterium]